MSENIKNSENQKNLSQAPIFDHLLELRSRLIRSLIVFVFGFCVSFYFSTDIYSFLVSPFFEATGSGGEMIFTAPQEFLITKLKVAIFGSSLIGLPYFSIEIYAFIAPGLYKNEKTALIPYFIATPFLFFLSINIKIYI